MKKVIVILSLLTSLAACSHTQAWVLASSELNPEQEASKFERDSDYCEKKYRLAQQAIYDYDMQTQADSAYDYCMLSLGWQAPSH